MKQNPCPCCKARNVLPTSRRGVCAHCQEILNVLDWVLAQEQAEAERIARRKATGLVLPEDLRKAKGR